MTSTTTRVEFGNENALRAYELQDGEYFVPDKTVWIPTGSGNPDLVMSVGCLLQKIRNRNSGQIEVVDVVSGQATHNWPGNIPVRRVRVSIKAEFV